MKTIEEKAKEAWGDYCYRAEGSLYSTCFIDGYMQGAKEAVKSQWRSVEDELPEKGQKVIIRYFGSFKGDANETHFCELEYNSKECLELMESILKPMKVKITHWMPIPDILDCGGKEKGK